MPLTAASPAPARPLGDAYVVIDPAGRPRSARSLRPLQPLGTRSWLAGVAD